MRILLSTSSGKQRSPAEIQKLPKFSVDSAEKAYRLTNSIYIDNVEGLGSTPNNQNILYKGFLAELPAKTFLRLALPGDREESAKHLSSKMKEGYGIGSPFLIIDIDSYVDGNLEGNHAKIVGHEGRARCSALIAEGITDLPVQFMILGYRARHVKPSAEKFTEWLNKGVVTEDGRHTLMNLFQHLIFG